MLSEKDTAEEIILFGKTCFNMTLKREIYVKSFFCFDKRCIFNDLLENRKGNENKKGFYFSPDDSGIPIFILSLLSVVRTKFGLRDGTGTIRQKMDIIS